MLGALDKVAVMPISLSAACNFTAIFSITQPREKSCNTRLTEGGTAGAAPFIACAKCTATAQSLRRAPARDHFFDTQYLEIASRKGCDLINLKIAHWMPFRETQLLAARMIDTFEIKVDYNNAIPFQVLGSRHTFDFKCSISRHSRSWLRLLRQHSRRVPSVEKEHTAKREVIGCRRHYGPYIVVTRLIAHHMK